GHPDHSRFVPFAANSQILEKAEQLKDIRVSTGNSRQSIDQSGTNIESAIETAIRSFAPHRLKHLILLTDGNENSGHLMKMLPQLKSQDIRVYSVPSSARSNRDVWIDSIDTPHEITAQELFPLEIHIYSQAETQAQVAIRQGAKILGKKTV